MVSKKETICTSEITDNKSVTKPNSVSKPHPDGKTTSQAVCQNQI